MSSHQWKPKASGLGLLLNTILMHLNYLLLSVAVDGEDGNGLKIEKISHVFKFSNCV